VIKFAIADGQLMVGKIEILNPQAHALHQAQATAIQQLSHQLIGAFQLTEHGVDLGTGEDHWHTCRALSAWDGVEGWQLNVQHLTVEKLNRAAGDIER
jgi:hypothetical protein